MNFFEWALRFPWYSQLGMFIGLVMTVVSFTLGLYEAQKMPTTSQHAVDEEPVLSVMPYQEPQKVPDPIRMPKVYSSTMNNQEEMVKADLLIQTKRRRPTQSASVRYLSIDQFIDGYHTQLMNETPAADRDKWILSMIGKKLVFENARVLEVVNETSPTGKALKKVWLGGHVMPKSLRIIDESIALFHTVEFSEPDLAQLDDIHEGDNVHIEMLVHPGTPHAAEKLEFTGLSISRKN